MSGLLVNNYSQRNPPALGDALTGLLENWGDNIEQGLLSALPVLAENDPYKIGQQLLREGAGVGGIAWHGSPHKFVRPDLSKMGTGEGAQAYGHGFYSAEARDVGDGYQKNLARQKMANEFPVPYDADFDEIEALIKEGVFDSRESRLIKALKADDYLGFDYPSQAISAALSGKLKNWDPSDELVSAVDQMGYLYKMNIPDETIGKMLDWDAPMSKQRANVRGLLDQIPLGDAGVTVRPRYLSGERNMDNVGGGPSVGKTIQELIFGNKIGDMNRWNDTNSITISRDNTVPRTVGDLFKSNHVTGNRLYTAMESNLGAKAASEYLNSLGIPGIKYLDGMSRAAGQGSRNFVSFTPDHIEMLERNGVPIKGLLD